ncbi:pentatricopeptide repeat-containing protein At4g02750 [Selaginella moellendorffii]|uniref:pentatricopeptide repeat-containing protein At4g02750 n=1 Tax=Selaginella moellendorffii TaxID=88036 RepID=UPI000D1C3ECA|nr:pentatricopeptide repeat-containing protein At4g02750 [Selaginella moellendorffii]|eukprot:XP_024524277.1 pentatricopeptide repeat-containing protein At4g02750 [Selaginella moellendorffii]
MHTILPFGKHKGKSLLEVPESYLRWMCDKMKDEKIGAMARQVLEEITNIPPSDRELGGSSRNVVRGEPAFARAEDCISTLRSFRGGLSEAEALHRRVLASGTVFSANKRYLSNLIILMFARCQGVAEAHRVFASMASRDDYSWNTMLKVFLDNRKWSDAQELFREMEDEGVVANKISCTAMIGVFAEQCKPEDAKAAFDRISSREVDTVAWNALVSCYSKCGRVQEAMDCFERMEGKRDMVSWNTILAALARAGQDEDARNVFAKMPEWDTVSWNSCPSHDDADAKRKFDDMQGGRSIVSFNSLLNAFSRAGDSNAAASVLDKMPQINTANLAAIVDAYGKAGEMEQAKVVFDSSLEWNLILWTVLLRGYAHNGFVDETSKAFWLMPLHDTVAYIVLLGALARHGCAIECKETFDIAPKRCVAMWTLLVTANTNAGDFVEAERVFYLMPQWDATACTTRIVEITGRDSMNIIKERFFYAEQRDVVLWTVFLSAYVASGEVEMAELVLRKMAKTNTVSWNAMLSCYASHATPLDSKKAFDGMMERNSISWTLLAAAYARHGQISKACEVLVLAPCWQAEMLNSVLAGYSRNGQVWESMELLRFISMEGIEVNEVSFVCLLDGFSHVAKVMDARDCFHLMVGDYAIEATERHYTCMIDLFGRARHLDKAEALILDMPFVPDEVAWHAFLGACRSFNDCDRAKRMVEKALELDSRSGSLHVLLANTLSSGDGNEDDVKLVKEMMLTRNVKRIPGVSRVRVGGKLHRFVVGDTSHPQIENVHKELARLEVLMREAGYVPNTNVVTMLGDDGDEERAKEELLCRHSEKLALGYAFISTQPGTKVEVTKNLRMCYDCHDATQFLSKVVGREIVVKDANRIHRFVGGVCSCKNIW